MSVPTFCSLCCGYAREHPCFLGNHTKPSSSQEAGYVQPTLVDREENENMIKQTYYLGNIDEEYAESFCTTYKLYASLKLFQNKMLSEE